MTRIIVAVSPEDLTSIALRTAQTWQEKTPRAQREDHDAVCLIFKGMVAALAEESQTGCVLCAAAVLALDVLVTRFEQTNLTRAKGRELAADLATAIAGVIALARFAHLAPDADTDTDTNTDVDVDADVGASGLPN
jgi:hypothetical protein